MKESYCSICFAKVDGDEAPVLAISGAGVPRCLCESCASDIDTVNTSRDYYEISGAMDRLTGILSERNADDVLTIGTMNQILTKAAERAKLIKAGTYDFSLDEAEPEVEDESLIEIPEDLLESEEDKELDEKENERAQKIDKVLNWVWGIVMALAVAFLGWWFFLR